MNTGQEALTLSGFTWAVRCVRFSPDGRRLATASAELVKLWDAQTGREQLTCRDPDGTLQVVTFSPDGRRLAAVGGVIIRAPRPGNQGLGRPQTGQEDPEPARPRGRAPERGLQPRRSPPRVSGPGSDRQALGRGDRPGGPRAARPPRRRLRRGLQPRRPPARLGEHRQDRPDLGRHPPGAGAGTGIPYPPRPPGRGHRRGLPPQGRTHLASAGTDGTVRVWDAGSGKELYTLGGIADLRWGYAWPTAPTVGAWPW